MRAVFNRFIDDHENRQRCASGRQPPHRHELRDRTHIERIASLGSTRSDIVPDNADGRLPGSVGAYSDQVDPLTDDDDVPRHRT